MASLSPTSIQTLGSPKEDMFTTVQKTKVTQFCLQFQMTVLSQHPLTTLEGLVDAISTAEQGLSEAPLHLGKVILITLWWPAQPWFPRAAAPRRLSINHMRNDGFNLLVGPPNKELIHLVPLPPK